MICYVKYDLVCIHNVVLIQALNLMQKIKLGRAPKFISILINFNNLTDNNPTTPILNSKQLRRLNRLSIHKTNIIARVNTTTKFANEPETSLIVHKKFSKSY